MPHRVKLLALAVLLPPLAHAQAPLRDDPRARLLATREWRGTSLSGRIRLLEEARRERDHYAGTQQRRSAAAVPTGAVQASAVQAGAFVNIGPASAAFEDNGGRYYEVDSGRARQIVTDPLNPAVVYIATAGGGVWKSYNSGQGWEPITDALGTTAIGTFAMDPSNPDILFLGFGDPFEVQQPGLLRSLDGGATWSSPTTLTATYTAAGTTYTRTAGTVTDIKVDPRNSLVVLAATDAGLFRSIDGGTTWNAVALPPDPVLTRFFFVWSLAWVGNDTWLLTGQRQDLTVPSFAGGTGALALYRSTDDGATWTWNGGALPGGNTQVDTGGRGTLAAAPSTLYDATTSRVFLLLAANDGLSTLDLLRSDDGGQSFQPLGLNAKGAPVNPNADQTNLDVLHKQAWYNQALLVDPQDPDTVFVGGDLALVRSKDGGLNWSVISDWLPVPQKIAQPYIHADFHSLAVGADGTFYAGSDGGIFLSANARNAAAAQVTFSSASNQGLVTHLIYNVACALDTWPPDLSGWMAGGMQDDGTRVRAGPTTTFNQVLGGDGIGLAVSAATDNLSGQYEPSVFYASAENDIFLSTDGGNNWTEAIAGLTGSLPFFVRLARDSVAGDVFLTFTGSPAAFYKTSGLGHWAKVLGTLHWLDSNQDTAGFTTVSGQTIGLRNLTAHPKGAGVWGVVSNRFTYATANGGTLWTVGIQPKPACSSAVCPGIHLLSSIAFDPDDTSGKTYYVTSLAPDLIDSNGASYPLPAGFGHLYKTADGGASWTSLGVQGLGAGGLPNVGFDVIKVDPGDSNTLYVGTEIGLYKSSDRGATWSRFGAGSLPFVEVSDLCITPTSAKLTAATYGRGFWQIDTSVSAAPAGVKGNGDTNFDSRIDGQDLIDLADAWGSTQASPLYRWQADLVGTTDFIDDNDLAALLLKFGGHP